MLNTLFNHIQYLFNNDKWSSFQTDNKVCFNNISVPCDEYVIEKQSADEISVSIPLNEVAYKKTFSLHANINETIRNYIQMHVTYYEYKKPI